MKEISVLKEDRQALGLFVSKCTDKRKAFSFPLTTYPLSIATWLLYQPKTKSKFRNSIIKLCPESSCEKPDKGAAFIYDEMSVAIRKVPSQKTWGDLWYVLFRCFIPNAD